MTPERAKNIVSDNKSKEAQLFSRNEEIDDLNMKGSVRIQRE